MSSIYDVAKLAGVSKTLVSRVINNQEGVGDNSRERIMHAMKELNYRPNAIARSLVLQKTNIIGVILDTLCEPFYFDFIKGIEQEMEASSYEVIFCSARDKLETKKKYIDFLSQGRADGYILYGSNMSDKRIIDELEHSVIPMVIVENDVDGMNINNISVDNRYGSEVAVNYLVSRGCKSIMHVTGEMTVKAAVHRKEGYENAMKHHGTAIAPPMIIEGGFNVQSGFQAIAAMLNRVPREELPQAIYFGADAAALGGMIALLDRGIKIPEEVKIIGFDNDSITVPERQLKKLTTLAQPMFDIGVSAAKVLLEDIDSNLSEKKKVIYYPELLIRETT